MLAVPVCGLLSENIISEITLWCMHFLRIFLNGWYTQLNFNDSEKPNTVLLMIENKKINELKEYTVKVHHASLHIYCNSKTEHQAYLYSGNLFSFFLNSATCIKKKQTKNPKLFIPRNSLWHTYEFNVNSFCFKLL